MYYLCFNHYLSGQRCILLNVCLFSMHTNSLSGVLLHLTEGPARLNAEYWFSYIQGAITLSKQHKVKGFRFGLLVSRYILSAHNVQHLCMPACATSKKEWLLPHLVCQKLDCIGSCWEKGKQTEEKRALFCPSAFVSGVVDVFFCGGVRMYVTQASSIFCAISYFFLRGPDQTPTHMRQNTQKRTHTLLSLSYTRYVEVLLVRCGHCWGEAGLPQESAAICFKSSLVNNGGGVSGKVGAGGGGVNRRKMKSIM